MLFDDPSCLPAASLQAHLDNGFAEVLDLEWCCIASISFAGKFSPDASCNIQRLEEDGFYLSAIACNKNLCIQERGPCMSFCANGIFFLRYRIRSSANYEVFYLAARRTCDFTAKEGQWVVLYFSKAYSNVLLNHEVFQQNEYIENVFNSIEGSVFVLDLSLNVVSYNVPAGELFQSEDPHEAKRYTLHDIPFLDDQNMESSIRYVLDGKGKRYLSNVIIRDKGGSDRIFYVTLAPLRDSKRNIAGVVAVCTDVTKLRIIQREVTTLEQYGMLGEVALGVSHDVKNPLMNINSCVHFLKSNWNKDIDYARYFSLILQETDRINITVDQLMCFGNISSEPSMHLVNLNEILATCIQIIERQKLSARFRDVTLETRFSQNIPPVKARALDLQQAILNILLNALQSIDAKGTISVSSRRDLKRQAIVITISDTGCGISDMQIQHIFSPYRSTKKNGTGLGLFLTKRTLERYKGTLELCSKEGVGTTCTITLPMSDE